MTPFPKIEIKTSFILKNKEFCVLCKIIYLFKINRKRYNIIINF